MPRYRFGDFELDLDALQLRLRGEPVSLERRPLNLLILLVTRRGQMVPREEIIASLWPAKVVIDFESGLNTLVRKVRCALGDSPGQPRFIETVSGRGYRFIAPVVAVPETRPGPEEPGVSEPGTPLHARPVAALALLLLAAVAGVIAWQSDAFAPESIRIAVLPFENLTGDEDLSYMASGLAEETSISLSRIELPNLAVLGRVSARAMANSPLTLQKIGRELDVDFAVVSSLQLDRPQIRVTSQLIRIADGEQVWSASFDRELTSVLGLQRELSIAIAEQVRQRLSPEVAAAIDRRQTRNPRAYELYLKGRYEWSQFSPASIEHALQYFEQAVLENPGYALAWAGIANALITAPMTADANPESILEPAREALQHALEYGPDLAEVQYTLSSFHLFLDWDWARAEAAARQAVTLDPNSAMSYMSLGVLLSRRDDHVEARAMMRRARELDPLFPLMFANSAVAALQAGDPRSALEFSRQAVAMGPELWVGYLQLGHAQLALGDYDAALQAYSEAEILSDGNSKTVSSRAYVLARLGREDEARLVLEDMRSQATRRYVPPYAFAVVHAGLGEPDTAFDWLEHALAVHDVHLAGLARDLRLQALRPDPRFESLKTRCGFVPKTD